MHKLNVLSLAVPCDVLFVQVDKVMEVHFKKNGSREFLIHWKGFSHKEDTWEPEKNLNCPDLIEKFMEKVDKASESVP
jgi:chromobox protein 5